MHSALKWGLVVLVMPFLSCAPPPEKIPGSAPVFCDRLKCHRDMLEFATQPKHITGCDVAFNLVG